MDPEFDALDENQAALLKSRAAETALAWAITDPYTARLFEYLTEHQLRQTPTSADWSAWAGGSAPS